MAGVLVADVGGTMNLEAIIFKVKWHLFWMKFFGYIQFHVCDYSSPLWLFSFLGRRIYYHGNNHGKLCKKFLEMKEVKIP
jgi:hypothetical protein